MVGAGLERDVERRAARALAGRLERGDLRVRAAGALVPALAHDLAVADEHGADDRIRVPSCRARARPARARARAARSSFIGDERADEPAVGARDVLGRRSRVPATIASAPASCTDADVLARDAAVHLDDHALVELRAQVADPRRAPPA